MRSTKLMIAVLAALSLGASAAFACHVGGNVYCDGTGEPLAGIRIDLVATDGTDYQRYAVTNELGRYDIALLCEPHCYRITAQTPNGETVVFPAAGYYDFCAEGSNNYIVEPRDWRLTSPTCPEVRESGACWLTGGGARFETPEGTNDTYKHFNWGGNVYPSCDPHPGIGGQWNMIDNVQNLHFMGTEIEVIRCGNVDDHEAGSESPVTPFNFIEFQGIGTLKGVHGNDANYGIVHFWAHVQDRNEPGSQGMDDLAGRDRIFMNVFTNPADPVGSSVVLFDRDGDPGTMDPQTITDGNLQLHASSCPEPAVAANAPVEVLTSSIEGGATAPAVAFLRSPAPNPVTAMATMRFGVPGEMNVSLRVFDAAGRVVRDLRSGVMGAGEYATTWDLSANDGSRVARGVYFVRLALGGQVFSRSVVVGR